MILTSFMIIASAVIYAQNNYSTIPSGITVSVKLLTTISSDEKCTPVFCVTSDVIHKNEVVITAGTPVVVDLYQKRSRGVGGPGKIHIKCVHTYDTQGLPIKLLGETNLDGERRTGKAVGLALGLGLTVMPIFGFLFLCIHGEEVVLPANTIIYTFTHN
ncbi:MAG: hypothetical protein RR034_02295 [Bacteroidales bacterium]